MSRIRILFYATLLMAIVSLLALPVMAQYGASLQGTVTDKTGAVVKGAKVTVTNQATGVAQSTETGGSGFYRVAALIPGQYTVDVESGGFRKSHIPNVDVSAESVRGLDVALELGGATETVTVTATNIGVQTENANISGAITEKEIQRLPQFGRDPYELLRLAPGVFGDGARAANGSSSNFVNTSGPGGSNSSIFQTENVVQATANGQRPSGNNFMVDGTSVNSLTWGGAAILTPNQESVKEVTVVANSYSAEDGRNSGAQVKVISKNGTNQFHGSAFFKYDEPGLNAFNKWGGPDGQPAVRVNQKLRQYGGSIGGPVWKDKVFFFFSYEGNRVNDLTSSKPLILETPQFDQWVIANRANTVVGNLVGAKGAAPRVTQILTPTCADLGSQWPNYTACAVVGNGLDVGSPIGSYGQYADTWNTNPACDPCTPDTAGSGLDTIPDLQKVIVGQPFQGRGNQYNARVDVAHGKDQFAVSFYLTPLNNTGPGDNSRPMNDLVFKPKNGYIAFLWNRAFSATLLNEARLNATRWSSKQYGDNPNTLWGLPRFEVEMIAPNNRMNFGPTQGTNSPGMFAQNQFEFRDVVSKVTGRHGLKFGFSFTDIQDNNNYEFGAARPILVAHGLWNFVNGAPIYEGINADPRTGNPTQDRTYYRQHDFALFGQDDFKLRPNLTLNLGLRYEYFAPLSEKYNHLSNFYLAGNGPDAFANGAMRLGSPLYPADRNNLAPRIGFAWSPTKFENKTVIRGGYGVAYNRITDTMTGISRVNPPFVFRYNFCCAMSQNDQLANSWAPGPFDNGNMLVDNGLAGTNYTSIYNFKGNPLWANIDPQTLLPPGCCVEIWGAPQRDRTPYVHLYSLDVQQDLPSNMVFTLGYAGSMSRKLLRIVNLNKVYSQGNAHAQPVYFPTTDANANYNALLANLTRHFSHGVEMSAKYRWSKSFDTVTGEGAGSFTDQFYPTNQNAGDRGPSDFDVAHSFLMTALWDVPFPGSKDSMMYKALGGWHIDGTYQFHTGFPWSAKTQVNCFNAPGPGGGTTIWSQCPQLPALYKGGAGSDSSNDAFMTGSNFPNNKVNGSIDTTYFGFCQPGPSGAVACAPGIHRNYFRGPRYQSFDLSLAKTTRLPFVTSEGAALDFRANLFNAFNKLNLAPLQYHDPGTFIEDPHLGKATGALAGRVLEFQMRLTF